MTLQQLKKATATKVFSDETTTRVSYHSTIIVTVTAKTIVLDTGGWFTKTTKIRMNQTSSVFDLGYVVFVDKQNWFIDYKGKILDFKEDKMILTRNIPKPKQSVLDGVDCRIQGLLLGMQYNNFFG